MKSDVRYWTEVEAYLSGELYRVKGVVWPVLGFCYIPN
jgi:hypothetical protein